MTRPTVIGLFVIQAALASPAPAQTEVAKPAKASPTAGYKVAYWYDRARPAETFRYQVYDLRKRQYDEEALVRWLVVIGIRFPDYAAYVKDVPATAKPGEEPEPAALAAAIEREKQRIVRGARPGSGPPTDAGSGRQTAVVPSLDLGRLMHPSLSGRRPAGMSGRSAYGLSPYGLSPRSPSRFGGAPLSPASPFPYPYPRPHP